VVQPVYEIRVAGAVPETDLRDMGAIRVAPDQVNTILYGIPDQAALHGLLARLESLGLDVLEVRRVSAPDPEPAAERPLDTDEESGGG
jgi:hypothetical protein